MSPVHTLLFCFHYAHFYIILPSTPTSFEWSLPPPPPQAFQQNFVLISRLSDSYYMSQDKSKEEENGSFSTQLLRARDSTVGLYLEGFGSRVENGSF